MLKNSKVANISGSYLSENKEGTTPGIPLDLGDSKVIFGFILHKGEEMDESVAELVEFLKSRLPKLLIKIAVDFLTYFAYTNSS